MDKNAIKKYAVWARNELIARVSQKAEQYEITENNTTPANVDSIGGRLLTTAEKKQRTALIEKVEIEGFEKVMEEIAYTWFNRFTALRFMEVNNYLPSHTRVFTNEAGEFKPQILSDAIQLELDGLDMDRVFELKDANKTEELYKYLLVTQCNALNSVLPRMFQKIDDYTELLLPDYLLREGSVIEQMITTISESDWTDQVQIIGWLYQYYNSEPKDAVFAALKKNVKISKENIPAATQLFTPDWIVRYMVENSLGRLWLEGHPNNNLKSGWKYYIDEIEQEADVQKQVDVIRKEYAGLKPEEIKCIDPCMGSGHILCYMFDVLVKIYEDYGYSARDAVGNIVEKNLWGLDIDERAAQLSYFAVMMKARQYDRRFFTRNIQPHVYAIEESNGITSAPMHDMGIELSQDEYSVAVKQAIHLVEEMHDAKEYGSLIHVTPCNWDLLRRFAVPRGVSEGQLRLDIHGEIAASGRLQHLIQIGEALAQTYHVSVTNPPYMGGNGMSGKLSDFVKNQYPDSKYDLFAVFIERCKQFVNKYGYQAMITQHSWMFLSGYEKLRNNILQGTIVSMAHLGARAFDEIAGEVVQTTAFITQKIKVNNYQGSYHRLVDDNGEQEKEKEYFNTEKRFFAKQESFAKIPSSPIAYWISNALIEDFTKGERLKTFGDTRQGMATSDNNRFLRLWYEVAYDRIGRGCQTAKEAQKIHKKWYPYNKGGSYRKWYGNIEYVLNYENDGAEVKGLATSLYKSATRTIKSISEYFKPCLSWSKVSTGNIAFRYYPPGFVFDVAGCCIFYANEEKMFYDFGFINSKIAMSILSVIAPTMNFEAGHVASLPIIESVENQRIVKALCMENVDIAKEEWDSYETSWDFKRHPLVQSVSSIGEAFKTWKERTNQRIEKMRVNEERLNKIFISVYGLENEMKPDVDQSEITLRCADEKSDIKSFISYAVGCMFGRYSLDSDGLIFAGGKWDETRYSSFRVDKDGIIPICDDEYFEDDIVGLFIRFVEHIYGKESLEENLTFIAGALGGKGTSREVIRDYFVKDFFNDHVKQYQKRPIYWLFDSGKKNGFKCLIYIHRYQSDTIARIRTDYVHEQQSRYRTAIADMDQRANNAGTSERVKLNKKLQLLQEQADELRKYEEKIHHLADQMAAIDLDDGIKKNYAMFQDVLAKI